MGTVFVAGVLLGLLFSAIAARWRSRNELVAAYREIEGRYSSFMMVTLEMAVLAALIILIHFLWKTFTQ